MSMTHDLYADLCCEGLHVEDNGIGHRRCQPVKHPSSAVINIQPSQQVDSHINCKEMFRPSQDNYYIPCGMGDQLQGRVHVELTACHQAVPPAQGNF